MTRTTKTGEQPHALYRFYGAGGTLLYIGITNSLPRRLTQHNERKAWWLGVSDVKVEHYPSREAVLEAEKRAIIAEKPLYNDKHNRDGLGKTKQPGSLDIEGILAELYVVLAMDILGGFPDERIEHYKAQGLELLKDGSGDAVAKVAAGTVLALGPAATCAFNDVYDFMISLVEEIEHLCKVLPADVSDRLVEQTQAKIAADPDLSFRDFPRVLLAQFTEHYLSQEI